MDVLLFVSWSVLHSNILEPLCELIVKGKGGLANDKDVNSQASVVIKNLLGKLFTSHGNLLVFDQNCVYEF